MVDKLLYAAGLVVATTIGISLIGLNAFESRKRDNLIDNITRSFKIQYGKSISSQNIEDFCKRAEIDSDTFQNDCYFNGINSLGNDNLEKALTSYQLENRK